MDPPMTPDLLPHLPDTKRRELALALKILFEEFEDATKTKLSSKRKAGRILKVILFGSYARGDWVEDRASGYRSDYDLLVIVSGAEFTDLPTYWHKADDRFIQALTVTHTILTPVNFIVHDLADVNDQLTRGRPFFSDIARDGIILYEAPGHPLPTPKPLTPEEIQREARGYFEQCMPKADSFIASAGFLIERGDPKTAAFMLHQATESLYHCVLLTRTLYSPKSHRLSVLRSQAERLDERLQSVWPDDTPLARQAFDRLQRAYVEARYSAKYVVLDEELGWLVERVSTLYRIVIGAKYCIKNNL
jgi:uncharacterized protein